MSKPIKITKIYEHSVEKVWNALTDAKAMSEWLMRCNFTPQVGNEFQFKTKPYPGFDGLIDCKVIELVENELLSYTWSAGSLKNTVVTFRLTTIGNKTQLDFSHSGFEGFRNNLIAKRILSFGWKGKILSILLPQYLDNE